MPAGRPGASARRFGHTGWMFATLLGGLPRPDSASADRAADDEAVREAVVAQELAGLEPLTDGRLRWPDAFAPLRGLAGLSFGEGAPVVARLPSWTGPLTVADWSFAASCTTRAVKQALPGPYTLGRRLDPGGRQRSSLTLALAEALHAEALALAEAGCPLVEIDEPDAVAIGDLEAERRLFREAHSRLAEGIAGTHLSLALTGGNVDTAGDATVFDAPYASYAIDLIAGPDNWRLVARAPADRGIVCGALSAAPGSADGPEVLVWAAHYAASTGGRGLTRVGLANAPGLETLDWPTARAKLMRLGEAARIAAAESSSDMAAALDPRAVDPRSAALGRFTARSQQPGRAGRSVGPDD
jgi:methionine synthase II (cobalamin-independent)